MRASDGVPGLQEWEEGRNTIGLMNARGLTDGGAARLGARQSSHGKVWWPCSRPTSGMGTTWYGVWYGQRGDGGGRRMRSRPWMPCKHPLGRRAPWVRTVPTTGNWHFGSDTLRSMALRQKPASTCSSSGAWVIPGASSGGRYPQCAHWKKWDGCRNSLPAGYGGVQSGPHLSRWPAPTQVWGILGVS